MYIFVLLRYRKCISSLSLSFSLSTVKRHRDQVPWQKILLSDHLPWLEIWHCMPLSTACKNLLPCQMSPDSSRIHQNQHQTQSLPVHHQIDVPILATMLFLELYYKLSIVLNFDYLKFPKLKIEWFDQKQINDSLGKLVTISQLSRWDIPSRKNMHLNNYILHSECIFHEYESLYGVNVY